MLIMLVAYKCFLGTGENAAEKTPTEKRGREKGKRNLVQY